MQFGVRRRGWRGLLCVLSSALSPAVVLAQIAPASSPVSVDDLTPYAGTYMIAAPGVAKDTYLNVLE